MDDKNGVPTGYSHNFGNLHIASCSALKLQHLFLLICRGLRHVWGGAFGLHSLSWRHASPWDTENAKKNDVKSDQCGDSGDRCLCISISASIYVCIHIYIDCTWWGISGADMKWMQWHVEMKKYTMIWSKNTWVTSTGSWCTHPAKALKI